MIVFSWRIENSLQRIDLCKEKKAPSSKIYKYKSVVHFANYSFEKVQ